MSSLAALNAPGLAAVDAAAEMSNTTAAEPMKDLKVKKLFEAHFLLQVGGGTLHPLEAQCSE